MKNTKKLLKIAGGFIPKSKSLNMPPPKAVMHARNETPNISSCELIATNDPDIANATVPNNSMIFIISDITTSHLSCRSNFTLKECWF